MSKDEYAGRFGEKKGKGEECNYIMISNNFLKNLKLNAPNKLVYRSLLFKKKGKKTSISLLILQNHVCTYLNCLFQVFPMFYKYTVISEHSEKVLSGIICNTS